MDRKFNEELKSLIKTTGIKERELSAAINYDITYISKWINGIKLPSERNSAAIIRNLAKCFAARMDDGKISYEKIEEKLFNAYNSDKSYEAMRKSGSRTISFISTKIEFSDLLDKSFRQLRLTGKKKVEIKASFDILEFFGDKFQEFMRILNCDSIENVNLHVGLNVEKLQNRYDFYCGSILDTIVNLNHVEFSIVHIDDSNPKILIIDDLVCIQILFQDGENFAACCSMDNEIIQVFEAEYLDIFNGADSVLKYAEPKSLKRTNFQLDSYSDTRQKDFFNEAPAMLVPESVMGELIKKSKESGNADYAAYLEKLSHVFETYTKNAEIDLIFYSSAMNDYVSTGNISIGNVAHAFTSDQVHRHIEHLSSCMKNNPNFKVYVVRDTVDLGEAHTMKPSIFLDNNAVTIENSQKKPNESYHISMNRYMRDLFETYLSELKEKSNCSEISAEQLLRFI